MPKDDRAIAISATFTAEPIQPALAFWMEELGLGYEVRFAPYNQVFQELLNPAGLFARNRDGINVVLIRLEDWPAGGWRELVEAAGKSPAVAPLIVVVCPGREGEAAAETVSPGGLSHLILPEDVAALYPVAEIYDSLGDELGQVPFTPARVRAGLKAVGRA